MRGCFPQFSCQKLSFPEGENRRTATAQSLFVWRGGAGHLGHVLRPCFEPINNPMGWKHYSRRLWLSRANHYILYLKAINGAGAH